jgi:hypothetical protein
VSRLKANTGCAPLEAGAADVIAATTPPDSIPRGAYRISEFARAHGFSRSHYYVLKERGQGPRETDIGFPIITQEDAAAWRKRRARRA